MIKKALVALAITGMMSAAQAGVVINEGFDNFTNLTGKGWILNNASSPVGPLSWFQGAPHIFEAQAGEPESYIAANYASGVDGGSLANWLITPEFSTETGGVVSFWLRSFEEPGYSDEVSFGFGSGGGAFSSFKLMDPITVGIDGWKQYSFDIARAAGTARFAIQYTGAASTANWIGVDSFQVEVPEPSSILILAAGVMGLAAARRRKRA